MNKIIISMGSGVIYGVENIPAGSEVEIRDFDIEYYDEEVFPKDGDGQEYKPYLFPYPAKEN